MEYFKINNIDFSKYVNALEVVKNFVYKSAINAAGNTIVKQVNVKRTLNVGIIPLDSAAMIALQTAIDSLTASISFLNPDTGLVETIQCMIPSQSVSYYTIQAGNVKYKAFSLQFTEL